MKSQNLYALEAFSKTRLFLEKYEITKNETFYPKKYFRNYTKPVKKLVSQWSENIYKFCLPKMKLPLLLTWA